MGNTPLVLVMISAGIHPRRAEAFERLLDDHPFVGISSTVLARIIETHCAKQVWMDRQARSLEDLMKLKADRAALELFTASSYNTFAASDHTKGH
jgi:hypothetical protein